VLGRGDGEGREGLVATGREERVEGEKEEEERRRGGQVTS
jgi:hypothetical protein